MSPSFNVAEELEILGQKIGLSHPTYFIADIAANHNGELEKAKDFILQLLVNPSLYKEYERNSLLAAENFRRSNASKIVQKYIEE